MLPSEAGINQYGSMFQHVTIQQCDMSDEDDIPSHPDAACQSPSPSASLARQPSPMDEDIERHEDHDVQGWQLVLFNSQGMDVAANQPVRVPPSPDAMDRSNAPVDEEIAVVTAPVEGRIVINVSDVESYGTGRHLLGDSLDGDSNDADKGVSCGVEMPSAPEPCPMELDAPSTASTGAGPVSAPAKDDFYNAESEGPGPSKKRRKSLTGGPTGAGNLGSALTTISAGPTMSAAPMPDFEKFAVIQRHFWAEHKQCFLFEDLSVKVDIAQCILACPQYVIQTLQRDIVDTVKKELIQLIDVKQRQKVCLTIVDTRNRLLKIKPDRWENIKDG